MQEFPQRTLPKENCQVNKKTPWNERALGRTFLRRKGGTLQPPRSGGLQALPPTAHWKSSCSPPTPGWPKGLPRGCANPRRFGSLPKTQCQPAKQHLCRWMEACSSKERLVPAWGSYSQKHRVFFRRKCNFHQQF